MARFIFLFHHIATGIHIMDGYLVIMHKHCSSKLFTMILPTEKMAVFGKVDREWPQMRRETYMSFQVMERSDKAICSPVLEMERMKIHQIRILQILPTVVKVL